MCGAARAASYYCYCCEFDGRSYRNATSALIPTQEVSAREEAQLQGLQQASDSNLPVVLIMLLLEC